MNGGSPGSPPPDPVKRIVAVLRAPGAPLERALERLAELWGEIDFSGPDRPFDASGYYAPEMGASLSRRIVSFRELAPPESLVEAKLAAVEVEDALRVDGRRTVNLDAGYLDLSKVVLASLKPLGQKIHLGRGVWADLVLRFRDGAYRPLEWTFPDFRDGRYSEELLEVRRRYGAELRARRPER